MSCCKSACGGACLQHAVGLGAPTVLSHRHSYVATAVVVLLLLLLLAGVCSQEHRAVCDA
jgi:hypothetical protein